MRQIEFGFERTTRACRRCTISCEHMPGALAPSDLPRMAAPLGYGQRDDALAAFAREPARLR